MKIAVSGYKCLNDINEFVEIRDITLITGKNSSGKSSFSEVYDFFTRFSNLAFGKTSLYDWFDIKINNLIFPNVNKFFSGIDKTKQSFEIGISKENSIQLILTFNFDENGFNIILSSVELKNTTETIFSVKKKKQIKNNHFIPIYNDFTLLSNLAQALQCTNSKIELLLKVTFEYLEDKKNQNNFDVYDQNNFDKWFHTKYLEPDFLEFIKNREHLEDFFTKNSFPNLTQNEYESIIAYSNNKVDFRFWAEEFNFPEDLWWKLYLCKKDIEKQTKEKFQIRFFSKIINLFKNEEFNKYLLKFCKTPNLDSIFQFKLKNSNEILFSETEIRNLELEWKNRLSQLKKSTVSLNKKNSKNLISFFVRYNEVEELFNKSSNDSKVKYLNSINIDTNDSCFPEANGPLDSFYRDFFNFEEEVNQNIEGELWYQRCKEDKVYPKNIWQAYLYLEYQIQSTPRISGDSEENKVEWEEIELPMNEQFALSSISFEIIGKIVVEDFIQNNDTELGLINGNNFQLIWEGMNSAQRDAFEKTFYNLEIYNTSLSNILLNYADKKSIVFLKNPFNHNLDIMLEDVNGNISNLNSLGSGHQNIVNIALEFVYHFTFSIFSKKKYLNVILVEPERFLHPNQSSSMVHLIYFFTLFKNIKIDNITRISPHLSIIIETHSEYLIRSFQEQIAQFKDSNGFNESFTINYFEKNESSNITSIRQIFIEKDGSLSDEFGSGFLDETELIIRSLLNARLK